MALIKTTETLANGEERIVRFASSNLMDLHKKTTESPVVCFTHDDSDGKLAGQLIREIYSDKVNFVCCNYSNKTPDCSIVKNGDVVFITDYCIPLDQLKPIVERAKVIVFMDHHATSTKVINANIEYFEEQESKGKMIIDIDMNKCGAKIVNDWLVEGFTTAWDQEVVTLIDKYDRWTKQDIRGDYLNQFLYKSAMSYIGSEAWRGLLYDKEYFNNAVEIGKKFYEFNLLNAELIYDSFSREVEFHGLKMRVIEGYGNSMLFGDHVKDYDAVCVFHITHDKRWQYSIYTEKPGMKLNEIAEIYGGGGHPSSCGWTCDERMF